MTRDDLLAALLAERYAPTHRPPPAPPPAPAAPAAREPGRPRVPVGAVTVTDHTRPAPSSRVVVLADYLMRRKRILDDQIKAGIRAGRPVRHIAADLDMGESSVHRRLRYMYQEHGVRGRAELRQALLAEPGRAG